MLFSADRKSSLLPKLNKATAEHPNNTGLVPQTSSAPSVNLANQLFLVCCWADAKFPVQKRLTLSVSLNPPSQALAHWQHRLMEAEQDPRRPGTSKPQKGFGFRCVTRRQVHR